MGCGVTLLGRAGGGHNARVNPILPPRPSSSSPLCPVPAGATLPVAPAKPTAPLAPFGEGSKAPASLCQHRALQNLAEIPAAGGTHALRSAAAAGQPLYGALPSGHSCSQKLTGRAPVGEHGGRPAWVGRGNRGETWHQNGCGTRLWLWGGPAGDGMRGGHEPPPRLWWQGQICWRNTWWRSAACASALRSPSAPTTGSGSSSNAAWPPPARPAVQCCTGGGWGELCTPTPLYGEGACPARGGRWGGRLSGGRPWQDCPATSAPRRRSWGCS